MVDDTVEIFFVEVPHHLSDEPGAVVDAAYKQAQRAGIDPERLVLKERRLARIVTGKAAVYSVPLRGRKCAV